MKVNLLFNSEQYFWKKKKLLTLRKEHLLVGSQNLSFGRGVAEREIRKGHVSMYGLYYVVWANGASVTSNYIDPHLSKAIFLISF